MIFECVITNVKLKKIQQGKTANGRNWNLATFLQIIKDSFDEDLDKKYFLNIYVNDDQLRELINDMHYDLLCYVDSEKNKVYINSIQPK